MVEVRRAPLARALWLASGAIGAGVVAVPAAAQSQIERKTEISAEVQVRHDTNVARADEDRAAARGLERADQRLTPVLGFDIARPFASGGATLTGDLGYDFYRRNTELNRERLSVDAGVNLNASICAVDLNAGFSRRQSDLGEIAPLATGGEDSVRNAQSIQNYGAALACGRPIGIRPTASIERESGDNSNAIRRLNNYDTMRYAAGLAYSQPTVGIITAQYVRSETEYENRQLPDGPDGFAVNSFALGFERELGAVLRGSVTVAYTDLNPRQDSVEDFSGITWDVALTADVSTRLRLKANAARQVVPSLVADAAYRVDQLYAIDGEYALTSALTLQAGFSVQPRKYFGVGTTFGPALTDDTRRILFATLAYERSDRLQFFLDGGYEERDANGDFYDYDSAFVAFRARYTFGR